VDCDISPPSIVKLDIQIKALAKAWARVEKCRNPMVTERESIFIPRIYIVEIIHRLYVSMLRGENK